MNPTETASSAYDTIRTQKTIFGHPAGLFVLSSTEMWERFNYYGMRSLLILYLTDFLIKGFRSGTVSILGFATLQRGIEAVFGPMNIQPLASQIYGIYTALVYLTPLFGGMLADRVLGQRKTVIIGAIVMAIGEFMMTQPSLFLIAMLFLILGNGCFKPNITTQVGSLYRPGDSRRDRAFTFFYVAFNFGAFLSPLICGTLGQKLGWGYGFAAAGVGMIVGLIIYLSGQRYLADDLLKQREKAHVEKTPLNPKERSAIIGLVVLCSINVIFWAVYEQQGNTLQLFADRNTDWHIFGFEMPSTWLQAFNPLCMFFLFPILNAFWSWQARRGAELPSVSKMAIGCTLLGLSFLPLVYLVKGLGPDQKISFLWLFWSTLVLTIGELCLSPIGLSLVTKVAPARLASMLMGVWFLSNFFGNYLTGYLGTFYEKMSRDSFFLMLAALAVGAGLAMFALNKPLKKAVGHDT
ncbi:MAG TPA: peptide MFS transporter [Bryobacteraceae bacterium]|nr:peptide MFS transporter [Bryobacteraceae bacterium]